MIVPQPLQRERSGQPIGVPNLQAIGKQADLDGPIAEVIAVGNRVDNGFADGVGRKLVLAGAMLLAARVPIDRLILPSTKSRV